MKTKECCQCGETENVDEVYIGSTSLGYNNSIIDNYEVFLLCEKCEDNFEE